MEIVSSCRLDTNSGGGVTLLKVVPGSRLDLFNASTRASSGGFPDDLYERIATEPHDLLHLCNVDRLAHDHVIEAFTAYLHAVQQIPRCEAMAKAVRLLSRGFYIVPDPAHAP